MIPHVVFALLPSDGDTFPLNGPMRKEKNGFGFYIFPDISLNVPVVTL